MIMKSFKKSVFTFVLLIIGATSAFGQAFTKDDPIGTVIEYQKGDKSSNIERMILMDKKSTPKGTVLSISFDDKEDFVMDILLQDDYMIYDLSSFFHLIENTAKEEGAPGVRFSAKGDQISIPLRPTLYAQYPDINLKVTIKVLIFRPKVRFSITDREIVEHEKINTPMGERNAFVYHSRWRFNLRFAGIVDEYEEFEMYQWIVPGIGVVKEATLSDDEKTFSKENTKVLVKKYLPERKK